MTPLGFDISHHNRVSSFHTACLAGFPLCIIKATEGVSHVDDKFEEFRSRVHQVDGMMLGCYHFGNGENPLMQADLFLHVAGTIPLKVLDFEENPRSQMTITQAEQFVQRVKEKTGRLPMLYSGSLIKDHQIPKGSILLDCELWLAHYSEHPVLPPGFTTCRLYQKSDGVVGPPPREVPGVGPCDIDWFPGSIADCRRWYTSLSA